MREDASSTTSSQRTESGGSAAPTNLTTAGRGAGAIAVSAGAGAGAGGMQAAGAPVDNANPMAGRNSAGASGMSMGAAGSAAGTASSSAVPRGKKFVGNITTGGKVRSDFIEYWDQLTPENEGKWGSVESQPDKMNWTGLDAAYNYAKQHNILFKQHTFVWGSQQPNWLGGLAQAEQKAQVEEWIRLYCERFPDTDLIDVVNEPPPHTSPSYMAALGGAGASGYDWIVQAFKWARQYCPNAILILNDYNTIENAGDNSHFIDIVQRIKKAGAPIDAVGAQAHAAYNLPVATVKMYIDKLASETQLPVYISEYDIDQADDAKQKSVMQSQLTMFWEQENVHGITLWGYIEGQTWLPNTGLMTGDGKKRPAMDWLMTFLMR